MESTKNSNVFKEVEKLLSPLREKDSVQYQIIQNLIDEVYEDPTLNSPEALSKEIENKLYKLIDDHIKFDTKSTES